MHKIPKNNSFRLFRVFILVILLFTTGFSSFSQNSPKDSIKIRGDGENHSARRATIYSAVLPGLGQIYNRKYWKIPIVYGGFATLGYFINFNNEQYVTFKRAYSDLIDNDPYTTSYLDLKNVNPTFLRADKISAFTENLRGAKDNWRRYRDMVVIGTAVFYALNIIDASVDANFFNFNISDDLSMIWIPGPVMCMDNKTMGIHCRITF